jgi:acetoin utilization deacetylase AcuC-like enzyme
MPDAIYFDERMTGHVVPEGFPERPERLAAVVEGLWEAGAWDAAEHPSVEPATVEQLGALHEPGYVRRALAAGQGADGFFGSPDVPVGPGTAMAARLAAGRFERALCLVRPPGHHAEADRAMGFCLFANAALAADALARDHGMQRVALLDLDVHHGNGSQHLLQRRADVLFVSLHEDPRVQYPGTGFAHEVGDGPGAGYTLNLPMAPGSGDDDYLQLLRERVGPRLAEYRPEVLLVSLGLDTADADPLGHMRVSQDGYAAMGRWCGEQADRLCGGRCIVILEGGYDLPSLAAGVASFWAGLSEFDAM